MMSNTFKKYTALLLIFLSFFSSFETIWASKFVEYEKVTLVDSISGKSNQYTTVNLTIGGEDVISDVPAILYNVIEQGQTKSRTLVPIRVISESLGAKVVWDGANRSVNIQYKDVKMVLTIDSPIALVNGNPIQLPNGVPAKLMNYQGADRALIPVRFVSEQFGLDVKFDGNTRTVFLNRYLQQIKDVAYNKNADFQEIVIDTTGEVEVSSYYLDGERVGLGSKLVVEIPNTKLALDDVKKYDASNNVSIDILERGLGKVISVKGSKSKVPTTRFEIDMFMRRGYEIIKENNKVRIQFINSVNDIRIEKILNTQAVVIRTSESPSINVTNWDGKVIVDIIDTKMKYGEGGKNSIDVNSGGLDKVSFSQLNAKEIYGEDRTISRVVLNLTNPKDVEHVYVDSVNNDIYIYVSGNPLNNFNYAKSDTTTSVLNIQGQKSSDITLDYNAKNNMLQVRIPDSVTNLNTFDFNPDDYIVERLYVEHSNGFYILNAKLAKGTTYQQPHLTDNEFSLTFYNSNLKDIAPNGQLIVVDAGHGGKDPGAISPIDKTREKDVVLSTAIKLQKRLATLGYRVYLTREYDTYINLYNRAGIANELGADVFISLHVNAAENTRASGVETLYVDDSRNSKAFAQSVQKFVVSRTGARDRGLVNRPKLVVIRETKMPAILLEIGFLTNATELEQLKTESYLDKIVTGILEGIINFLN